MRQLVLRWTMGGAIAIGIALSAFELDAIPANPGLLSVEQPDGTELRMYLSGDHRAHICTTEDGYLLFENDGFFYYATIDERGRVSCSDRRALDIAQRSMDDRQFLLHIDREAVLRARQADLSTADAAMRKAKAGYGLFPGSTFPVKGSPKALVILVEYTDVKFRSDYDAHDYFSRMLNAEGFTDFGGTGSCRDYFIEASQGQFSPQFDIFGPVTLAHRQSYYGGNNFNGNDKAPAEMITEACDLLDGEVDFSQYDNDGDGVVDNIYVFYAGRGEASGGSASSVWPHSWNLTAAGFPFEYHDGVRVETYGCSNERTGDRVDGIGTFCHEFSHVMGLPDLYAISYNSSFTPGNWSVVDHGSYNNDGCTPPTYSAFERYALGWIEPEIISEPADCTLGHILLSNKAYILPTSRQEEYFLLENRQQRGSDLYIPGHGMLIWHVDYDEKVWAANAVNDSPGHQHVDIVEADALRTDNSRDGDAFPGTGNVTSFTRDTDPAMTAWGGEGLDFPITDIEENDGVISFKVKGGEDAAIEGVSPEGALRYLVNGLEVELPDAPGTILDIYDCMGHFVVRGTGKVRLPARGLYIAKTSGKVFKFIAH